MASLNYKIEDQSWYGPIPSWEVKGSEELNEPPIDVVLLTAVPVELEAVLRLLSPLPGQKTILCIPVDQETYYLGLFGKYRAAVTMCEMGAISRGGAILATFEALLKWMPRAIIMPGIAFGMDPKKQNIADVLISSQVISYGNRRVGERLIYRGPRPEPGLTLLNRFRNTIGWTFTRLDGTKCVFREGPILSGGDLVDDPDHKKHLFEEFPHAIGGEMEGAGVYAAAARFGVEWIIVKAICDWADGKKHKKHQPLAAAAASSLVHFVLSRPHALPPRRVVIDEDAKTALDQIESRKLASRQRATSEDASSIRQSGWIGVTWDKRYIAYDGPLEQLQLIEDEVFQQSMADALTSAGFTSRLARPDKLLGHAQKGYRIVYLTDQKSWRRRIIQFRKLLIARRADNQTGRGTGSEVEHKASIEKQQSKANERELIHLACHSLTKRTAKLLIDNRPIIPRHAFRAKLNEFLASPARYCFVLGSSGVGKSVTIAVEALRLFDVGWSSLLIVASSFSIEKAYKRVCEELPTQCTATTFRKLIQLLIEQGHDDLQGLVIFIDAIDDTDPDCIASELLKLHEIIGDLPIERLKIVITCRDISWEYLRNHPGMPIYQQATLLGLPSTRSYLSVEISDFAPAELDSALEEIGAQDLLLSGQLDNQDNYHILSLRELLKHPGTFGHYANLKSSKDLSLIKDLTWSRLVERSINESLTKASRRSSVLVEDLREYAIRFASHGWQAKARGFTLSTKTVESSLPELFTSKPGAALLPYSALLETGILIETKTPGEGSTTSFRVTDAGAYFLSVELERRLSDKPIKEFRKIGEEWLREAWNFSPSLDAVLAWIDRLVDNPYDKRLLNLIELIIKGYHYRTGPLFGLVRPAVIASIFEIVKREDIENLYSYWEAARGIRYSPETIRIIRDHLKDPDPKVRQLATELIGIHRDIESKEELLKLFADADRDVRSNVYGAFRRFGKEAIETLIEVSSDTSKSPELRGHCLGALRGVGYRDDRISASIDQCLSNPEVGNPSLLKNAFLLAAHLRDKAHTSAAKASLKHEDQEVVQAAAKYLTEVPDPRAFDSLKEALRPRDLPEGKLLKRYWLPRQLIAALMRTDPQKAEPIVLELMRGAFKGEGEFHPVEAVWAARKLGIPALYAFILEQFVLQIAETPKKNIVLNATDVIGGVWRDEDLKALVAASENLAARGIDLAPLFVKAVANGMEISEGYRLADKLSRVSDLNTPIKCEAQNFIHEAASLLDNAKRWNLHELCKIFWVAGDSSAEPALLKKLENPGVQDDTSWYERSSVAKALGTCGGRQSWEAILDLFRTEENISLYFDQEALYPLALRKIIRPADLATVVRDNSYCEGGRTLCLITLALLNVRRYKKLFVEAAGYSEKALLQQYGARLLGFTKDSEVAPTLLQLVRRSNHPSAKSEAAEALGRLGARHAVHDIEHVLQDSPASGFINALAQFQEPSSLPLILEGAKRGSGEFSDDYLTALGAFWRFPDGREAIEAQFIEWAHAKLSLFDEQLPVVAGLLRYEPGALLARADWLLANGYLKSGARAELAKSIPHLTKRKDVDRTTLIKAIKRLVSDRNVTVRELTIRSLHQVGVRFCRRLYSELINSADSAEWDRACAVQVMAICGSDVKQIESMRYDRELLVRRAADEALAVMLKRPHLQRHVEQLVMADGLARLSAYVCLEEQGDLFSIAQLNNKCRIGSLSYTYLRSLSSKISERLTKEHKEKQEKEDKLEESRGTIWYD